MTEEEMRKLEAKSMAAAGIRQPTSNLTSTARGAASGFLGGFQPQVAGALEAITPAALGGLSYDEGMQEAQRLNEQAQTDNPLAYGAGYVGGTAASIPVGGAAVKGAGLAAKGLAATRAGQKAKELSRVPMDKLEEFGGAAFDKLRAGATPAAGSTRSKIADVATSTPAIQAATRATGFAANTPPDKPFGRLTDMLDEEQKRREAMKASATPEGRAQTNTDAKTGSW